MLPPASPDAGEPARSSIFHEVSLFQRQVPAEYDVCARVHPAAWTTESFTSYDENGRQESRAILLFLGTDDRKGDFYVRDGSRLPEFDRPVAAPGDEEPAVGRELEEV